MSPFVGTIDILELGSDMANKGGLGDISNTPYIWCSLPYIPASKIYHIGLSAPNTIECRGCRRPLCLEMKPSLLGFVL